MVEKKDLLIEARRLRPRRGADGILAGASVDAPFVISFLDVRDGIRLTYRGSLHLRLPRGIDGSADPYGDLVQNAQNVTIRSVSLQSFGDAEDLARRAKRAWAKPSEKLVMRLVATGNRHAAEPAQDVVAWMNQSNSKAQRAGQREARHRRILDMLEEDGGTPDYERMRHDPRLLALGNRDFPYNDVYIRELKKQAVDERG